MTFPFCFQRTPRKESLHALSAEHIYIIPLSLAISERVITANLYAAAILIICGKNYYVA